MIAIATGIIELDKLLKTQIEVSRIINYREYLFKEEFSTVILSSHLLGDVDFDSIIYYLKEKGSRIIFLTNIDQISIMKICFKYGVYDLVFDPITAEKILQVLGEPKEFKDISKIFLKIFDSDEEEKLVNIENKSEKNKKSSLSLQYEESYANNKCLNKDNEKESKKKNPKLNIETIIINKHSDDGTNNNEDDFQKNAEISKEQENIIIKKLEEINKERIEEKNRMEGIIQELKKKLEKQNSKEPVVIKEIIEKVTPMYIIDKTSIAIFSNASNGKSFISWILGNCFADFEYTTSIINIDRNCSMNYYFNIEGDYENIYTEANENSNFSRIYEECYKANEKLRIITGKALNRINISKENFEKLFNVVRSKSDITIIDCETGINDITKAAISQSNVNIIVFDNNPMNFHLNLKVLEELKEEFIPEKTIAIINNVFSESKSLEHIYSLIEHMNYKYKVVTSIENCGSLAVDAIYTKSTPYYEMDKDSKFKYDIDNLIKILKVKNEIKNGYNLKRLFIKSKNLLYYLVSQIGKIALAILSHKAIFFIFIIVLLFYFHIRGII